MRYPKSVYPNTILTGRHIEKINKKFSFSITLLLHAKFSTKQTKFCGNGNKVRNKIAVPND